MNQSSFARQIIYRFGYLFDDYGFSVVHEEDHSQSGHNAIVVLESPDCRIRVLQEREQILVDVGPLIAPEDWSTPAPDLWFGLTYVTGFLSDGYDQWEYEYPDTSVDHDSRVDRQLIRLAHILLPYCSQIVRLFRSENFAQIQRDLLAYQERQVEVWLKSLGSQERK